MAILKTTSVTRDESNILVAIGKLETKFDAMTVDLASARIEIKEINTGITGRLLNLESNTVSKTQHEQLDHKVDALDLLVNDVLKGRAVWRGQIKIWLILGGGAWAIAMLALTIVLSKYFHIWAST